MSTTHFNSSIVEIRNFSSTVKKIKNFDSVISHQRNYSAFVTGFSQTDSWFAKFVQLNNINASGMNLYIVSGVDDVAQSDSMLMDYTKIYQHQYFDPYLIQANGVNASLSQGLNAGLVNIHSRATMRLSLSDKIVYSGGINMNQTAFNISASITATRPYYLSDWDSYNLSDLDSYNLSAMETYAV